MSRHFPMTARGEQLLKQELQQLKTVDRHNIIAAIAEARSHGDLSENAEYEAAKNLQSFIEGRIAELENKLALANVIDPKELNQNGIVVFGTTVTLEDEQGNTVRYQIVGEDEADIKAGRLNVNTPIAKAVIGKEEGESVQVTTPKGIKIFEIVAIEYI